MRSIHVALVVVMLAATANAQPGAAPQPYPPPPPQPSQPYVPPPGPGVPPAYAYQPQPIMLTAEEQELLEEGEISDGRMIAGVGFAFFVGFGTGQAVQGRWGDTGWIFTVGEAAAIGVMLYGVSQWADCVDNDLNCDENDGVGAFLVGLLGFGALHIWEIADAAIGPSRHNRRVRSLRMRMGIPQPMWSRITPVLREPQGGGGMLGLSLSF